MAETETKYRRIPGKKKCVGIGYYTLWEAEDHLLQICSRFGVEEYKRFYFADIQAVVTCRTSKGLILGLILSALTALCLWAAFEWRDSDFMFVPAVPAVLFGLFALINALRGPTCVSCITTAVQTENLQALERLRPALKFMDRLRFNIHRHQRSRHGGSPPLRGGPAPDPRSGASPPKTRSDSRGLPPASRPRTVSLPPHPSAGEGAHRNPERPIK